MRQASWSGPMSLCCLLTLLCLGGCPGDPAPADMGGPPDLLPAGTCAMEAACPMGFCLQPGAFIGCGACKPVDPGEVCKTDDECRMRGGAPVCTYDPRTCACRSEMTCRPGCTATSCPLGEACYADLRCAGAPCTADTECPMHFQCGINSRCERQRCRTSSECTPGFCVGGACYKDRGTCNLPVP